MPPSSLTFRSGYRSEKLTGIPRTPKSPHGAYTGEPVPPLDNKQFRSSSAKVVFAVIVLGLCLLFVVVGCWRNSLLPADSSASAFSGSLASTFYRWTAGGGYNTTNRAVGMKKSYTPSFEQVLSTFADKYTFQHQSAAADRAWLGMFPRGNGRVAVPSPREYGLPASVAAVDEQGNAIPDVELYNVAVVAQLDCLAFIRHVLIDYDHEHHPPIHDKAHLYHCLDHLRQALLCHADTTLEPTGNGRDYSSHQQQHYIGDGKPAHGGDGGGGYGYGPTSGLHVCKNWTVVKTWIEENGLKEGSDTSY